MVLPLAGSVVWGKSPHLEAFISSFVFQRSLLGKYFSKCGPQCLLKIWLLAPTLDPRTAGMETENLHV